ncbi:MBL fold metallo-hydrolase [Streptomyces sp. SID13031]|uniref:MBL fold metallo-hydrolase n=1 Tax=Streptomyces sp. SID13031 TaxID=2706046 RepID=UPI0013C8EF87|nr:MBL fold metallo-hydrolase [Streptomyces sp. SID13031]NEA30200.1 MBL fold metallo-hydrolase [Streptomyces sp. SID13031]
MATNELSFEVHVSPSALRSGEQRMPNGDRLYWNPLSTTLIYGAEDAVLVDPPFLTEHIQQVGDWIERSGKRLIAIYATHGHGDHWFGTGELVKRFPGAVAYATPGTIEMMHQQAGVGREQLWDKLFPGQIPLTPVLAEPMPAEGILLEGQVLRSIEVGHTDTDETSVLHVPSIGLVVAGDVAYNGIHQYILEGANGGFEAWIAALDEVMKLAPTRVVAGHKNRDLPDDPIILERTKQYLQDVTKLLAEEPTAQEFYDQMTERHPDRLNRSPLWYGALSLLAK